MEAQGIRVRVRVRESERERERENGRGKARQGCWGMGEDGDKWGKMGNEAWEWECSAYGNCVYGALDMM